MLSEKEKVIDKKKYQNSIMQIIEIDELQGARNKNTYNDLFFMKQINVKPKYIRIILNNDKLTTEAGALYYLNGNIKSDVEIGNVVNVTKKIFRKLATQEKIFNPIYIGKGEVILEPSFGHFLLLELNNEEIIVDKSMYYCSLGDIEISTFTQKNASSVLIGGEGLFQTKISGSGIVGLSLDVPISEVKKYELEEGQVLQVDGNFAVLRSGNIKFTVEKSSKSLLHSAVSGEGFLQTFRGNGVVWLTPTSCIYSKLESVSKKSSERTKHSNKNKERKKKKSKFGMNGILEHIERLGD